jgi:hypothetical protein
MAQVIVLPLLLLLGLACPAVSEHAARRLIYQGLPSENVSSTGFRWMVNITKRVSGPRLAAITPMRH